ncbi:hypothetical protein CQW23_29184 [Capsicum baccatum]|uniref:Cytochrome 82C4 n=1 Tax=Capsicum baccatum TaxID=33114 RepID=A0A2G2VIR0_CAPBA|nr:hypothetical protein CQW23_29184 [Capsicum baccatum]
MLFLASYGDYWRKIRKIVINEVLSSSKLEKLRNVRVSEVKTSIKDLYSLFPISGDQNFDFPVTADHFTVTGDNFPVGGDDVSFTVDGDEVNFPVTGDHFSMTGDDFPVDGDDISFIVDGDNVIKPKKQPLTEIAPDCLISGANLDFPVTGGDFRVKVNITNWIEKLTLSLIVKMIAGKSNGRVEKGGNEEEEERFKKGLKDFMSIGFVLWDAFPIPLFKWIDIQGHVKFMKRTFRDIDCVLQSWLDEYVKKRESVDFVDGNEEDFIDMLSMMSNEDFVDGYSRETTIKATALSMVLVASDTTATHLNWVMATLLNHRDAMKKVQDELDTNVGRNRWVEESDIKDLRTASYKDTHIPKGTRLWVNTMKLHRDPKIWSNPDTFDPERFLTSQARVDVRGHHYEFIPFGSGRRSCPGITYATQVTHLAIAHLLQGFDFSTPSLDMKQGLGVTMCKADPIEVFITPRLPSVLYKF